MHIVPLTKLDVKLTEGGKSSLFFYLFVFLENKFKTTLHFGWQNNLESEFSLILIEFWQKCGFGINAEGYSSSNH